MIANDIKRLSFTISKGNKPNVKDKEALNCVIDYVNKEKERCRNNYSLFAKLYITSFKDEINRREGNYQLIADSLRMVLARPLESIFNDFHQEMNEVEFSKRAKILGLSDKHPILRTDKENESDRKIISNNVNDLSNAMNHFNIDSVRDRVNIVLETLIEDYGNK